jgi:hypothetical protein
MFLSSYCDRFSRIMYRLSFRKVERMLDSEWRSLVEMRMWSG